MRERLQNDVCPDLPPAKPDAVRLTGLAGLASFVFKAEPELAANAMLCATNQAAYLLRRQVESQAPMRLRHARKGPHAGDTFWGCTNYPDCDGLRDAAPDRQSS